MLDRLTHQRREDAKGCWGKTGIPAAEADRDGRWQTADGRWRRAEGRNYRATELRRTEARYAVTSRRRGNPTGGSAPLECGGMTPLFQGRHASESRPAGSPDPRL